MKTIKLNDLMQVIRFDNLVLIDDTGEEVSVLDIKDWYNVIVTKVILNKEVPEIHIDKAKSN